MFIQTHPMDAPARMRFTPGQPGLPAGAAAVAGGDAGACLGLIYTPPLTECSDYW